MLRTIFSIGLFAVLGLFVLKVLFGIFGVVFSLFAWLLWKAITIGVILAVIYLIIRVVSPDMARRLRERWSGV